MLVLERKLDQSIVINGNIVVTLVRLGRDRVKLGISAPLEIPIVRSELLEPEDERRAS